MKNESNNKTKEETNEKYDCFLTTADNPFNPSERFDDWQRFDEDHGYYTCSYLARMLNINDSMTDEEVDEATENAIDRIIALNNVDEVIYKKIKVPKKEDKYIPLTDEFLIKDENERIQI